MDPAEFARLLAPYPVVRSADSRRDWRSQSQAADVTQSASPAPVTSTVRAQAPPAPVAAVSVPPPSVAAAAPVDSAAVTVGFFPLLERRLLAAYAPPIARQIIDTFRTSQLETLKSLSLDELELIATSIKHARNQASTSTNTTTTQHTPDAIMAD